MKNVVKIALDVWWNSRRKESVYKKKRFITVFSFFPPVISSNIPRYFNNNLNEFKVLKKVIITETFNVDFPFCACILPNPSVWAGQFFMENFTDLNSKFSFSLIGCHTKVKEPNLSYYLCMNGRRRVGCRRFLRVLVLCEIQAAPSRFELELSGLFPTMITLAPRRPSD